MKTVFKAILLVMGIILALVVCLSLGLHIYADTDSAKRLVLTKINESIPGSISWQDLHVSLLQGRIQLQGGALLDAGGKQLIGIDDLMVDLAWHTLVKGELTISSAEIKTPRVYLGVDRDNTLSIVNALISGETEPSREEETASLPVNIVVDELVVSDGTIVWENQDRSDQAEASGIKLTAKGDLFAEYVEFAVEADHAEYSGEQIKAELNRIFAGTRLRDRTFDPIIIQAETGFSKVHLKGTISDISHKPLFHLVADVVMSLPEIRETFALSGEFTGEVKARIEAKGTLDNPEVHSHLVYTGGSLGGQHIDSAELDVGLKDREVVLERAHAAIASGSVSARGRADLANAFPEGFFSGKRDLDAISFTLSIHGEKIDLTKIFKDGGPRQGVAASTIELAGTGVSPDSLSAKVSAEIDCKRLSFDETAPPLDVSLKTSSKIEEGMVQVEILEALSGANTLEAAGWIDLPAGKIDARIELDMPKLKQDIQPFGIDGNGRLRLAAHVSQSFSRPTVAFSLDAKGLSIENITIGDIACAAALSPSGMLTVSRFALENQGSTVKGSGAVKIYEKPLEFTANAPVQFSARLDHVELKDFLDAADVTGSLNGELSLGGTIASLDSRLVLDGSDLAVKNIRIGNIRASARYNDGTLTLEEADVKNRDSSLNAAGSVKIFDEDSRYLTNPEISFAIEGSPVFLQDIADGYKGSLSLKGSLMGTLRNLKGEVLLSGKQIDLGVQTIDNFTVISRIDGSRIILDSLKVEPAEGEAITGTGWVSLEKEYAFDLRAERISLAGIQALQDIGKIQGRIALDVSGQGTFENPGLHGKGTVSDVVMNDKKLDDVRIEFDLKDRGVKVAGDLDFAFNATYHLVTKDFTASANFDNTDLETYFQIARQADLSGRINGRIETNGNSQNFDQLRAEMALSHLDIAFKGEEIVRTDKLEASVSDGVITVPGTSIILGRQGWLEMEGTAAFHGDISLEATGDIPLIVVTPFMEDLTNIEGHVLLEARVGGTWASPDLRCELDLKGIGFDVPYTEERLHDASGRITITPQMVVFEKIAGRLGDGGFDLKGKVELADLLPQKLGFRLNAQALPVRIPDTLDLYTDLELQMEGTPDKSLLQGRATLLEGVYYRDVKLSLVKGLRTIVERRPPERPVSKQITMPFLKNMELDISVKRRNPLYVDNNLAQLDINPDLTITGTLNAPIINGRAGIESGTVEFRNRIFTVTKGVVDFLNPYQTEATIDLESEVSIRDWMIYLKITGTPDALNLSLRSDPPEEDSDILSLLVLGKTSREFIEKEGGSTQSTSAMIAGLVASRYGEDFKEATGLDILEVESGVDEEDSAEAVKVTIGKELSRRITLKYAMESKNSELSQRAIAEYKLLENIVVNGFQDTRGIFGADVLFRLEFR